MIVVEKVSKSVFVNIKIVFLPSSSGRVCRFIIFCVTKLSDRNSARKVSRNEEGFLNVARKTDRVRSISRWMDGEGKIESRSFLEISSNTWNVEDVRRLTRLASAIPIPGQIFDDGVRQPVSSVRILYELIPAQCCLPAGNTISA